MQHSYNTQRTIANSVQYTVLTCTYTYLYLCLCLFLCNANTTTTSITIILIIIININIILIQYTVRAPRMTNGCSSRPMAMGENVQKSNNSTIQQYP